MSGVPAWAVRGAKVVCVDPNPWWYGPEARGANVPVKDAVYTIREIVFGDAVLLEEIRNAPRLIEVDGGGLTIGEPCFAIARFRPVIAKKSEAEDLALFRHHIDQRLPVDA